MGGSGGPGRQSRACNAFGVAAAILATGLFFGGCVKSPERAVADKKPQMHKDIAPHGGTPVALSDDYNLELVREADAGTLSAYVLDDEMEEFIRSSSPSITIVAKVGGNDRTLVLAAVANPATGETVGDTSLFQVQADWLRTIGKFDGTVQGIIVRGTRFGGVTFSFPGRRE